MKALKIAGIVILVIIILMIVLPFLFKDQIVSLVKQEANKNLTAVLNFEDASLNLFSSFPDLTLSLDELSIVNKAPFDGDTLLYAKEFSATVDLWSVISGDQIQIEGIHLIEPDIFVYVLEDSTANYNITKPDTSAAADTAAGGDLAFTLKKYSVENGNIAYIDQTSGIAAVIKNLNHSGNGDFSKKNFLLETETSIESVTFEKGGIKYLNNVEAGAVFNLDADMDAKKFTFRENEVRLNNLTLKFDGDVQMPGETILMNMTFASINNSFKEIISLIPAVYSQKFNTIETSGSMNLKGAVNGEYKDEKLPKINIDLNVSDGRFKYPDLPVPVSNVNMNLNVSNPGGTADQTIINMSRLHLEVGKEPFDASLLLRNPVSVPFVDTKMKGRIDLSQLKNAMHLEGVSDISGIINADFQAKGNIAGADQKTIENLDASGTVSVNNLVYKSADFPDEIKIATGTLTLTPKKFNLDNLAVRIGKSDLNANGQLENMISYILSDGTIKGNLNLTSNYFDINPFMKDEEKQTASADTSKVQAVSVPERINFTLNSGFNTLIYDNLTLNNVKGTIIVADERVIMNNLSMNTLGGSLIADGYYHAPEGGTPDIVFNLNITNLGFKQAYESFVTVQKFAPMAKYIDGRFNSKLNLTSSLDEGMKPVWDSFNSTGSFSIHNAAIKGFKPFEMVGDKLNLDALKNPSLNNVSTGFSVTRGRLFISPFNFKVLDYNVKVSGSNGIDQSIDYVMGVAIPASNLKQQGNKAISSIVGKDLNLITANTIEVNANIKGTIDNPSVSTSAGNIAESTTQQVTTQVKEEVNKQIEQKKEEVKQEVQKQVDTVQNKLKKEAENKLKDLFKKRK